VIPLHAKAYTIKGEQIIYHQRGAWASIDGRAEIVRGSPITTTRRFNQNAGNLVRQDRRGDEVAMWQVQDAKTRFSEVIERARTEGPQAITRDGAECAIVLSIEDYRALAAHKPDFKAYLLGGPKVDDFSIERSHDTAPC
jgi:prevent-host-death family protein